MSDDGFKPGRGLTRYRTGTDCPGCGRSQWLIGRATAECAFCATALPLLDSRCRTPRVVGFGKGGGKVSRMMAA